MATHKKWVMVSILTLNRFGKRLGKEKASKFLSNAAFFSFF
jgi:hypothetical protein